MAIIKDPMHQEDHGGIQIIAKELALGAADASQAPTLTITGTVSAAGTGSSSAAVSTGGVASKVIAVDVAGVTLYLPLFSSNA